jgi:hypothetical protein
VDRVGADGGRGQGLRVSRAPVPRARSDSERISRVPERSPLRASAPSPLLGYLGRALAPKFARGRKEPRAGDARQTRPAISRWRVMAGLRHAAPAARGPLRARRSAQPAARPSVLAEEGARASALLRSLVVKAARAKRWRSWRSILSPSPRFRPQGGAGLRRPPPRGPRSGARLRRENPVSTERRAPFPAPPGRKARARRASAARALPSPQHGTEQRARRCGRLAASHDHAAPPPARIRSGPPGASEVAAGRPRPTRNRSIHSPRHPRSRLPAIETRPRLLETNPAAPRRCTPRRGLGYDAPPLR